MKNRASHRSRSNKQHSQNLRIDLSGQVAVVTGGGAGIGRACAIRLAESGAKLDIADIDADHCDAVLRELNAIGRRSIVRQLDMMMDVPNVEGLIRAASNEFGRLDILINNVGGVRGQPFVDQSERSWRRHIDINLVSMLSAASAAIPAMINGGRGGAIVNVASNEGQRAAPGYAACKAAMISFTKSMALELSEHGTRVNAISPDHTKAPDSSKRPDQQAGAFGTSESDALHQAAMSRLIPLRREGLAEECGDVAAYLCSALSSYVTGVNIPVDGGTAAAAGWRRGFNGGWTQIEPQTQ